MPADRWQANCSYWGSFTIGRRSGRKVYEKGTTMLNLPSQYVCNLFQTCVRYISVYQHTEALLLCVCLQKAPSSGIYVNKINVNPSMDKLLHRL